MLVGLAHVLCGHYSWAAAPSPAGDPLEVLVERSWEVRERLLSQPTDRGSLVVEYEKLLAEIDRLLVSRKTDCSWEKAFLLKGYVTLSILDRSRERFFIDKAQVLVDALTPGQVPIHRRIVSGLPVIFRGDDSRQEVALTFDGGPGPDTAKLLDYLKSENIAGTFFLLGCFAQKNAAVCRRIATEGHVVANHTMTHGRWKGLAKIGCQAAAKDIEEGVQSISAATGVKTIALFRPPYGNGAEKSDVCATIGRFHTHSVMWTIDTWDSLGAGLDRQIRRVLDSRRLNGSIVLCHDHSKHILKLVQTIVPELKRRGYRFTTVPELITTGEQSSRVHRLVELVVRFQVDEDRSIVDAATLLGRQSKNDRSAKDDRLALESLDLAYLAARLRPQASPTFLSVRAEIASRFGGWARWALPRTGTVVE